MIKRNELLGTVLLTGILLISPGGWFVEKPYTIVQAQTPEQQTAERLYQEGVQLLEQGTAESLQEAIAKYQEALQLFRDAGDRHGEAKTLGCLGMVYSDLGEQEQAIHYLTQALQLSEAESHISNQITSLVRLGWAYEQLNQLERAISYYDRALILLRTTGEKTQEANVLAKAALTYRALGNFERAIAYFTQAHNLYEAEKDLANAARMLQTLGSIYLLLGNTQNATVQYEQALSYWQALNSETDVARVLRHLGSLARDLGNYQQAINHYSQALSIWQSIGDRAGEAELFQVLGLLYQELGDIDTSISYYKRALSLWESLDNSAGQAEILSNIGSTYYAIDNPTALSYYEQALFLWESLNQPAEAAQILHKIGWIYYQSGNERQAEEYLNRSLQLLSGQKLPREEVSILARLARLYGLRGETDRALEYLTRTIAIVETLPESEIGFKAIEFSRIANSYYLLNDYEKALNYHNQALQLWQSMKNRSAEASEFAIIARIERDRGHLKEALSDIESAITIIEDLRTKIDSEQLRQSYFAQKQGYYEFYIDLLMQLHQQNPEKGYHKQALSASERARARTLLELLAEANADIRTGIDPELREKEANLQQRINATASRRMELLSGEHTPEQANALKQELETLLRQLDAVRAEIRQTSPRYAALTQPQPLSAAQIQQQVLDEESLLLEYSLGENRSFLWAVTRDNVTAYELPPRAEIESAAREFRDAITAPTMRSRRSLVEKATARLKDAILSPVADRLGDKRLLIVGDGALHYVPFAALPAPGTAEYRPLIADREVIALPSASTLALLRDEAHQPAATSHRVAIVADPVFSPEDERLAGGGQSVAAGNNEILTRSAADIGLRGSWTRLPFTRDEATAILTLIPDAEEFKAFDFDANRLTVTSDRFSQYRIVHFATHGLLNSVNPELSGIVLSLVDRQGKPRDGFLRLHDIFNLNLNADLVVLSACTTGLGEAVKGEGLVGLTRGFMYAGSPRLVVSLWSVEDKATAVLMSKFYDKMLSQELTPAEALREAQLEMWQSENWKLPYFWAGFTLQGEWR